MVEAGGSHEDKMAKARRNSGIEEFEKILGNGGKEPGKKLEKNLKKFITTYQKDGFPLTDDSRALFIYEGPVKDKVTVPGDFNSWAAGRDRMKKLPGTNFHYLLRAPALDMQSICLFPVSAVPGRCTEDGFCLRFDIVDMYSLLVKMEYYEGRYDGGCADDEKR